jgi:hypothetical protein
MDQKTLRNGQEADLGGGDAIGSDAGRLMKDIGIRVLLFDITEGDVAGLEREHLIQVRPDEGFIKSRGKPDTAALASGLAAQAGCAC